MTLVKVNTPFSKTFDGMMKELFSEFPASVNKTVREDVLQFPPVNIVEKKDRYEISVSAPGFEKADFIIKLDANILTISTEKKETVTEETDMLIRREFTQKGFKRSFTIDDKIDAEKITARYDNGILVLDLPKKEEVKKEEPKKEEHKAVVPAPPPGQGKGRNR